MRLRNPRLLLTALSLGVVAWIFLWDLERTEARPLSAVHAQSEELLGPAGCERCHGVADQGMSRACAVCHEAIGTQLIAGNGFHGALTGELAGDCGPCHEEHHGRGFQPVNERSFVLAGFASRGEYDHSGLDFALGGRHRGLVCNECHLRADVELLHPGEVRFGGLDQNCTSCHENPHRIEMLRGCADCHGEQRPFAELAAFVHTEEFELDGAHAEPDCVKCHEPGGVHSVEALAGVDPPPARTCAACHESPHDAGFLAEVARREARGSEETWAKCHSAASGGFAAVELEPSRAQHEASGFALDPPHDIVACEACHASGLPFAARYPGRDPDDCAACHVDVHGGQFAASELAANGCLGCHDRHAFQPIAFGFEEHARCGFELLGSHASVACHDCHLLPADEGAPRVFRGTVHDCASCHEDAHGGMLAGAEGGCASCHVPTRFRELIVGSFDHGHWTSFELDGAHEAAECEACHARSPEPDDLGRTFGRAAELFGSSFDGGAACAQCHADVHTGAFDAAGLPAAVGGLEGCARCHGTTNFRALAVEAFDHALWTGFPLEGVHGATSCESCHRRGAPDADGRAFSRVAELYPGPVERCDTCHVDVHGGAFNAVGLPATIDDHEGCARCHSPESWTQAASRFDHSRWTGYELSGAHARAKCSACHTPTPEPRTDGRTHQEAPGTSCVACHQSPHAGQFAKSGRTDCSRCHESTASFAELLFDHQRDSRFPLDETHAKLDCKACHVSWSLPGGKQAVRYKPLGTVCGDCHGFDEEEDRR
jgi:hypothetical protein